MKDDKKIIVSIGFERAREIELSSDMYVGFDGVLSLGIIYWID
jgi:hypothetical protein